MKKKIWFEKYVQFLVVLWDVWMSEADTELEGKKDGIRSESRLKTTTGKT